MISQQAFEALITKFAAAGTAGDGAAFAACFTPDGVYHDYIYGPHQGRASIAEMLTGLFHRDATDYHWQMFDPITDGHIGYSWSLSNFTSTIPQFQGRRVTIDGMSRFVLKDGLIEEYRESVNGGIAMRQLGVEPERMAKVFDRWSNRLLAEPHTKAYLQGLGRASN